MSFLLYTKRLCQMINNIYYTVENNLCTGCGICEDVCPAHSIKIERKKGEYRPVLDTTLCFGDKCGRCLKVCPGVGVSLIGKAKTLFKDSSIQEDKYIGRYVGLYTGYSLDEDIRYHSASGGMVSQFLIYMLENNIIDGAVVTGFAGDYITPISYIARTKEEVLAARSSKYCPVALNKVGNEIVNTDGTHFVIVGLPCHIQGFRKRASIDKKFREKIVGLFAIYCSSGRTFNGRDYLFRHYKVPPNRISYFAFRDNGCLGNLTINHDGKKLSVPFSSYYGSLLRSFFKPHRCLTCIDHYGELADVCFGDIHIKPYSDDKIGISSWIVRTEFWKKHFENARDKGYIKMESVDAKVLNDSQGTMLYPKKRRARAVMNMDRLFGRSNPIYDKVLDTHGLKDYITEIVCWVQQFIGRRRYLWWIIELVNKGKSI